MSVIRRLNGWNVHIEQRTLTVPGENGQPSKQKGYALIFPEVQPPTGNVIIFEHPEHVKDFLVREYTGLAVPGLHIPKL